MLDTDAEEAGVIFRSFVQVVLPFGYDAQLTSSIVQRVPVFVVNNLAFGGIHYEMREQKGPFAYNYDRIAIGRNAHIFDVAVIFPVRRVLLNVKDFIENIGVNFDNPALNFEHKVVYFAFCH